MFTGASCPRSSGAQSCRQLTLHDIINGTEPVANKPNLENKHVCAPEAGQQQKPSSIPKPVARQAQHHAGRFSDLRNRGTDLLLNTFVGQRRLSLLALSLPKFLERNTLGRNKQEDDMRHTFRARLLEPRFFTSKALPHRAGKRATAFSGISPVPLIKGPISAFRPQHNCQSSGAPTWDRQRTTTLQRLRTHAKRGALRLPSGSLQNFPFGSAFFATARNSANAGP